ncbi:amidohydrolase family protein [Mycolicibacterium sp. CBM1]
MGHGDQGCVVGGHARRTAARGQTGPRLSPDRYCCHGHRCDIWQALRSITVEAAGQIFEEDRKGTLEPGKLADLVILDANPLTVETDALLDIAVVETLKEGRRVYRAA